MASEKGLPDSDLAANEEISPNTGNADLFWVRERNWYPTP